jgi:hypothetical protein
LLTEGSILYFNLRYLQAAGLQLTVCTNQKSVDACINGDPAPNQCTWFESWQKDQLISSACEPEGVSGELLLGILCPSSVAHTERLCLELKTKEACEEVKQCAFDVNDEVSDFGWCKPAEWVEKKQAGVEKRVSG